MASCIILYVVSCFTVLISGSFQLRERRLWVVVLQWRIQREVHGRDSIFACANLIWRKNQQSDTISSSLVNFRAILLVDKRFYVSRRINKSLSNSTICHAWARVSFSAATKYTSVTISQHCNLWLALARVTKLSSCRKHMPPSNEGYPKILCDGRVVATLQV